MVNKKILNDLKKIKNVKEKLKYIENLLLLKNIDERIRFLKELRDFVREDELRKTIDFMIAELSMPSEIKETMFPAVEEEHEDEERAETRKIGLESFVGMEEKETEGPKEYFITPTSLYESTVVEDTPLLKNIRRELERKGILGEGAVTSEQRSRIMDEIEKYSPSLSPERVMNYTDLLSGGPKEYKVEHATIGIRDILEKESKTETKYVKRLEAK